MTLDLEQTLDVPEFKELGLELTYADLVRHVFVTGASGSGKSRSIVMPLLRALARQHKAVAPDARPALCVIDVKRELADVVREAGAEAVSICTADSPAIDLFGSVDRTTIDGGMVIDRWLSLTGKPWSASRDPFWQISARTLLVELANLDCGFLTADRSPSDALVYRAVFWRALASKLRHEKLATADELRALLNMRAAPSRYMTLLDLLPRAPGDNDRTTGTRVAEVLSTCVKSYAPHASLTAALRLPTLASETSTSIVVTTAALLGALTDRRVQQKLCLDPLPPGKPHARLSLAEAIRRGDILVFVPEDNSEESACIARGLKLAWYDAVLRGAAIGELGLPERLAVFVADEFQRVITTTGVSDAHYTDRCRSFGGSVIAATQSTSALRERLGEDDDHALRALLANFSTRVTMSTMDMLTLAEVQATIPPAPPGFPHLITVRPPALFSAGEALWVKPGNYGIGQIRLGSPHSTASSQHPSDQSPIMAIRHPELPSSPELTSGTCKSGTTSHQSLANPE